MDKPCNICIVAPCCSKCCLDYAKYVYETKEYEEAGEMVKRHISSMPYDQAINHILQVENTALIIDLRACWQLGARSKNDGIQGKT